MKFGKDGLTSERDRLKLAIDCFASEMKKRVLGKQMEGYHGWDDPDVWDMNDIEERIEINLAKRDEISMVDIANLAMFAWNRMGGDNESE